MKIFNILLIVSFLTLNTVTSYSEEKANCSKINKNTIVGNIKYLMCKRGSDKIDSEGNFKKGTFNIFKKIK